MIKISGCLIILFGAAGLINSWSRRKQYEILLLMDFKMLFENGAFYLAKGRMKTPVFFEREKGQSDVFNQGCRQIAISLKNHWYRSGQECWREVWSRILEGRGADDNIVGKEILDKEVLSKEILCKYISDQEISGRKLFDRGTRELIISSGDVFFEKSAKAMEVKLSECAGIMEKEIAYHQKKYKENIKVLCPVGMLCGLMLSIILM